MKPFHQFIHLCFFTIAVIIISTFDIEAQITDYYYYDGNPYQLLLTTDQIFIELNQNVDKNTFDAVLSQYPSLSINQNFNLKEKKDFVIVRSSISRTELNNLLHSLNERSEILNASPVFKMPEGTGSSKVLIAAKNEIIAQFNPKVSLSSINSYLTQMDLSVVQQFSLSGGSTYLLKIPKGGYSIDYANELYLSGLVNYSEPNLFFTNLLLDDPNDPYFPQQWSHRNTGNNIPGGIPGVAGCDMRTDSAWLYTMGDPSVIVAMVDTG
ncbi:MAG TPA: hypothetical protein VLB50_07885, partial [Ignavibacteriaceae bacterium]|nr:hypothetical protein [Ignavibacteriaceae bacterium]